VNKDDDSKKVDMDTEIAHEALTQMRERGGKWAAYMNMALDSGNAGHLQFLKYGEGCTYAKPPEEYPMDNIHGMGWRYRLIGIVDIDSAQIHESVDKE
jgi:hypothetical protein